MNKVAIVILNWNGCAMLRQFLPAVIEHSSIVGATVYVADNGSTDDSLSMLTDFLTVQTIVLDRNYGFADGYNLALKQIEAQYYLLLNSDVEVTPHWLEPMIAYLDAHSHVVACQPKIRSYHHRDYFEHAGACGGFIDQYGYPFCRGRVMDVVERDDGQYDTIVPIFWASGAALFIRSDAYWKVGGLDGRFFAHMEEIDLCWRLRSRAMDIVCIPQSVVYHVGGATLKKENPKKTFLNFRNNLFMLYKNLPPEELRGVMLIRTLLDYIATVSFLLKGQLANAKAVIQARRAYKQRRAEFTPSRLDNVKNNLLTSIPEQIKKSILVLYYIKHINSYGKIN